MTGLQNLLLKHALQKQDNGRYSLEAYIHNLAFPIKSTSEDIDYEQHNLWLIDEKLSYHHYIASDVEMDGSKKDNEVLQRLDLIIFDRPIAITDELEGEKNFAGLKKGQFLYF